MRIYNKLIAFTLSEILFALGVVGVIVALTIPNFTNDINRKMLSAQTKKTYVSIQDSFSQFMLNHGMQRLDSRSVQYFPVNEFSATTEVMDDAFPDTLTYKNLQGDEFTFLKTNRVFATCDNGVTMMYGVIAEEGTNACYGEFVFDVNGFEGPNIAGRDLHAVYVTRKGQLVDYEKCKTLKTNSEDSEEEDSDESAEETETQQQKIERLCKNANSIQRLSSCITHMQLNGWKMDY